MLKLSQVRFVLHTLNGTSALNASSPASSASLQTSLPLVSDAYGTVASQPQVVEREGAVGFEWLVSWKPPRLSLQRLQCVCFMASVDVGVPDSSSHHVVVMSLPHCITFVIAPDPPPSWSQSALGLRPLRIVMGTLVTIQIQATDDNPDDIILLQSLTLPANMPSFVKIVPGTCTSVCHLSHRPTTILQFCHPPSQMATPLHRRPPLKLQVLRLPFHRGDLFQSSLPESRFLPSLRMAARISRYVSKL